MSLKRNYFSQLDSTAARALQSFVLHTIADAFASLFIDAFLWRTSSDINLVAIYNLLWFVGFPIGFYITGHLLRRLLATQLYFIACMMQGFILSSLIFFSHPSTLFVILYGSIFGIATGMFYANSHFLTLRLTNTTNRIYFFSLGEAFGTVVGFVLPPLAGFFITFGIAHQFPSYPLLFSIMGIFLVLSGVSVARIPFERASVPQVTLPYASKEWRAFRLFMAIKGLVGGVGIFLPTLLVLTLLGNDKQGQVQPS